MSIKKENLDVLNACEYDASWFTSLSATCTYMVMCNSIFRVNSEIGRRPRPKDELHVQEAMACSINGAQQTH